MISFVSASAIAAFQAMFMYSGVDKIQNMAKKVEALVKKVETRTTLRISNEVAVSGMIAVVILEIIGSLILIIYAIVAINHKPAKIFKSIALATVVAFIAFVIVVTYIYHPFSKRKIPFLSNVSTTAGFVLIHQLLSLQS